MGSPPGVARRLPAWIAAAVRARAGVDRRALAATRIALGLLVLVDVVRRSGDLVVFYTDAGVLPRPLLFDLFPTLGRLSPYALSGSPLWAGALFLLTALVAVALAAGYHSRLAALALFVLLAALHTRNPVVVYAGDSLLRRLLLWGALLPLGARWGLDAVARRGDRNGESDRVVSVATAGVLVQAVAVYAVNAVLKLRGEAWRAGEALRYVFGVDALTTAVGDALADQAALLAVGAHAWLALLVASPLLLLATGRARTALVAAFAAGHLFTCATMRIDIFPFVPVASRLPFLPPAVWDRAERRLRPAIERARGLADRLPHPRVRRPGRVAAPAAGSVAAALLAFVLVWNAAGVGLVSVSAPIDPTERRWDMFAPNPQATDEWYVPVGTTADGERVDVLRDGAPAFDPPERTAVYANHRRFVYAVAVGDTPGLRAGVASYLCDRWERSHRGRLSSVELVVVERPVRLDAPDPTRRRSLGEYDCGG